MLDRELPAGEVALEGEVGDAHGPMMRHHAGHGSTDRDRRRPDRTRRPPVGDGVHAGRVARPRAGRPAPGGAGSRRGRGARRRRPARSSRASGPIRIRGPRTGRRSARSCRVSATSSRRRSAGPTGRRAPADPRWRLHGARRCDGRPARGTTGRPLRDRLVRCARRLQHARHDAVGQRLGDAVRDAAAAAATRTSSRPPTARRSWSRTRRCSAGRSSTRPNRGCSPSSRVAQFGAGMLGDGGRAGRGRGLGTLGGHARRRDLHRLRHGLPRWRRGLGGDDARARRPRARDGRGRRSGSSRRPCRSSGSGRPRSRSPTATGRRPWPAAATLAEAAFAPA